MLMANLAGNESEGLSYRYYFTSLLLNEKKNTFIIHVELCSDNLITIICNLQLYTDTFFTLVLLRMYILHVEYQQYFNIPNYFRKWWNILYRNQPVRVHQQQYTANVQLQLHTANVKKAAVHSHCTTAAVYSGFKKTAVHSKWATAVVHCQCTTAAVHNQCKKAAIHSQCTTADIHNQCTLNISCALWN